MLAGWILSDTVFSPPYATTAQMNGPQRDLAGKTLKYRGRFGGAYREDADGFAFHLEREIGGRMMVCLRRESPHPELKYGDPIVVTISFTSEGVAIADRIDRR